MPITTPTAALQKAGRTLMSAPEALAKAISKAAREQLKGEFKDSHDPDGNHWPARVDGKPALRSKRLPGAFTSTWQDDSVKFSGRVERDWLEAHDQGHTFAARNVDARQVRLRFNAKGRLVKSKRFEKLKRGRAVFARAHAVGGRVLPPRKIVPGDSLPSSWQTALKFAALGALNSHLEKMGK